ncbi:MAG: DUF2530 domain-containing protein [Actinobacteria bacterium]|nr:DUF2530 domain-containing protein [Actinomycetota bacterium]MCG2798538.1 DUF2530 domain-containing protein [Cellulomonas sp.]
MGADGRPRLRPSPAPLDVDLHLIMAVGTAGWALILIASGVLALLGHVTAPAGATSAAGIAIGLYGMHWARKNRTAEPDSAAPPTDGTGSPTP